MASIFWRGGSGNWSDNTKWDTVSGGPGPHAPPTSTDDAIFDSNSFTAGNRTVTFDVSPDVKSMDFTGSSPAGSIIPTNSATIRGNLTLVPGMSWGTAGTSLTFDTTGTTANLTTAGVTI